MSQEISNIVDNSPFVQKLDKLLVGLGVNRATI
jgi:hypothetical protein